MSLLKRIIYCLILIGLFVAGMLFVVVNDQQVSLDLFTLVETPPLSLGFWVLAAFGLGLLLGLGLAGLSVFRLRILNRRLARDRDAQKQELQTVPNEKR